MLFKAKYETNVGNTYLEAMDIVREGQGEGQIDLGPSIEMLQAQQFKALYEMDGVWVHCIQVRFGPMPAPIPFIYDLRFNWCQARTLTEFLYLRAAMMPHLLSIRLRCTARTLPVIALWSGVA